MPKYFFKVRFCFFVFSRGVIAITLQILRNVLWRMILSVCALGILLAPQAQAQTGKRVDLDDLVIKGQLHDDRMQFLSRQKNELKNYIKFRENYRQEIASEIPVKQPVRKLGN